MINKTTAEPLENNKNLEDFINFSDLLLALRSGWQWIFGLILISVVASVVWDGRRPPLYEAKATIRIGWVHGGFQTVPIEPIDDLIVSARQRTFLNPFFAEASIASEREKDEFVRSLSIRVKAPRSNLVEFKIISRSPENARAWLERLISMKVNEHGKVIEAFTAQYKQRVAECFGGDASENPDRHAAPSNRCMSQELMFGKPVPPLMAMSIISEPVNVQEASVFPSLRFLIAASILGGLISGTLISFVLMNHKRAANINRPGY